MGGEKILLMTKVEICIDPFKWTSVPGKEEGNHMSAMIDQYCLQQIHQVQLPKSIHAEPVKGCKLLEKTHNMKDTQSLEIS